MTQMANSFSNKVNKLEAIVYELRSKIDSLHHTLHAQAMKHRLDPQKEQELRSFKKQLASFEKELERQRGKITMSTYEPLVRTFFPSPFEYYS